MGANARVTDETMPLVSTVMLTWFRTHDIIAPTTNMFGTGMCAFAITITGHDAASSVHEKTNHLTLVEQGNSVTLADTQTFFQAKDARFP